MTDTDIIWKYLTRTIGDNHIAIYSYSRGTARSRLVIIDMIFKNLEIIFCPSIGELITRNTIQRYLESKKEAYSKGELKLTSLY